MDKLLVIFVITLVLVIGLLLGWIVSEGDGRPAEGFAAEKADPARLSRASSIVNWFGANPAGTFGQFKKDTHGDIIEFELGKAGATGRNFTAENLSRLL